MRQHTCIQYGGDEGARLLPRRLPPHSWSGRSSTPCLRVGAEEQHAVLVVGGLRDGGDARGGRRQQLLLGHVAPQPPSTARRR
jgi:hypothetical protein